MEVKKESLEPVQPMPDGTFEVLAPIPSSPSC